MTLAPPRPTDAPPAPLVEAGALPQPSLPQPSPPRPSATEPTAGEPAAGGRAVLVTGAGGPAGVAVVRRLAALGHRVVAGDADPRAAGGALAHVAVILPRADHPGFVDAVAAVAALHGADALVPTVAEELGVLRAASFRLAAGGLRTWLPDVDAVELCCDKVAFADCMRAAGVAHPVTGTGARSWEDVPGPWVVKPRTGRGSRGVQLLDRGRHVAAAMQADPDLVVQTRLSGREFSVDALVARDGELLTAVPRWREETRAGISTKGTTFASDEVTALTAATLAAVGLTGPANVQGFVDADGRASVMEVNPRFSGGLPLTLAAGADVVSAYLTGIREPGTRLPLLWFTPGVSMSRYFAETYTGPHARPVADPCAAVVPA